MGNIRSITTQNVVYMNFSCNFRVKEVFKRLRIDSNRLMAAVRVRKKRKSKWNIRASRRERPY